MSEELERDHEPEFSDSFFIKHFYIFLMILKKTIKHRLSYDNKETRTVEENLATLTTRKYTPVV